MADLYIEERKRRRREREELRILRMKTVIIFAVLVLLAALHIHDAVVDTRLAAYLTVEAGTQTVTAEDFVLREKEGCAAEFITGPEADLNVPGDYPVEISYRGREYDCVLRVRDTVAPQVTVQPVTAMAPQIPDPGAYVASVSDVTAVTVRYLTEPDGSVRGDQTVKLVLTDQGGNSVRVETTLTLVFDETAPAIEGAQDLRVLTGQQPDYLGGVTVSDDLDEAPTLTVDDSAVDLTTEGSYPVTYTAKDAAGNETRMTVNLIVTSDSTPPSILGVNPISLYLGSTVSYRSGILVTDDKDENPTLSVDNSQVDLSQPGVYQLTYTATDVSGNASSITTTVTVKEKTDSYVEQDVILAAADKILDQIITDGMTQRQQVQAIYDYVTESYTYIYTSDKTDWMQAAYTMMQDLKGDCFNYYAITKLLMDRLNIPNLTVRRGEDSVRDGDHWWSLVSVDGGETYYHVDTTPRSIYYDGDRNFCMVTDAFLEAYNQEFPGYYTRDLTLYPATPTE